LHRLDLIADGLQQLNADIILLQEVFAQVPVGIHTGKYLAKALGLSLSFIPARKKLRMLGDKPTLCYSGLAVLSKSKPFNTHPIRLPMDERDGERIGQMTNLHMFGLNLQIGNVHLSHLNDADALRRQQLETMVKAMDRNADISILGGDMNAPQGSDVFQGAPGYVSPNFTEKIPFSSLNPVNGYGTDIGIIDHLFLKTRKKILAINARIALDTPDTQTGLYPSDHKAVVMDVQFS